MKPLAVALSEAGTGVGRDNLTNLQCNAIWNWHNESPQHNENMLIKNAKKREWSFGNNTQDRRKSCQHGDGSESQRGTLK
jgi:hypothetical protein